VGLGTQNIFKDIIHDIDGDTLARNIAHKLAAGLTGCLSAQATDNACESGAIGAVVGEMWGDYHNTLDPSHPNYQNQKDKLISQAKLIAGITAAYAGEDVNLAASVAAEAVENNSLRAVVQTVKMAGKLVKVAVKNSKVTIKDLKDVLRKEGFDLVDDLITLTDGQLTFDDAKAIIDLVVGTNLNNRQEKIDMIVKKRGLNTNPYSFSDLEKIASKFGYESKTIGGVKLFYNKKGNPKYLIRSNTSHSGDVFKGVNDERSAINIASRGSSKAGERLGSYNIHLERVGD
ncbi:VENN motif pre-toxin domain-containing protein, partial [Moraxella catarrhalis]